MIFLLYCVGISALCTAPHAQTTTGTIPEPSAQHRNYLAHCCGFVLLYREWFIIVRGNEMKVLITYDRRLLGTRFTKLKQLIDEHFPSRWHCYDSSYIVATNLGVTQVRELLLPALDTNDSLLVIELGNKWAGIGLSEKNRSWLDLD